MEEKKDFSFWTDRIKDVVRVIVFFGLAFAYWMLVLLIISFIFVNIWMVQIDDLIKYALILMTITGIIYTIRLYQQRKKEAEIRARLNA